jgi:prepilin-type N-terminal cleavage/methylation domain-containing protein
MKSRNQEASRNGFTMLEILMAMSISLIILSIGAGLALQAMPVERKLTRAASKLEVAARKATLESMLFNRDSYLTIRPRSITGTDGVIEFDEGDISIAGRGHNASFAAAPSGGYQWKFGANGLCEPILVRITFPEGNITLDFDPLTGETRDRLMTMTNVK